MDRISKGANQSYYRIRLEDSDVKLDGVDLSVNCCGECVIRSEWGHAVGRSVDSSRNDYYLIFSLGGDMVGRVAGEPVRIGEGELICISPGTPYLFGSLSPMKEWTHYYWIHFTGYDAERTLLRSGIEPNKVYAACRFDEVYPFYEKLFSEFRLRSDDFEYNAALLLRSIFYTVSTSLRSASSPRLDKSIRYIHTHLRYPLSVEDLAAMDFLGVSRYRELFTAETGVSPTEYIARLRIERAKDLLIRTNMNISEVGESVGYVTRHYFQSAFKRRVGMTPGEYRRVTIQ